MLRRLQAEREEAAAGGQEEIERLQAQVAALESALKGGGAGADTGERSRDKVRKAIAAIRAQLSRGGWEERAFAEHLESHLSIGYECLYNQAQGRIWA